VIKDEVLKPRDPTRPTYRTAGDVLRAIVKIERDLQGGPPPARPVAKIESIRVVG